MTISKTYRREMNAARTVGQWFENHPAAFDLLIAAEVVATIAAAVVNL